MVLSVLAYRDGKVGIWRSDPGMYYTDKDGIKRVVFMEPDMQWTLFRGNLPKEFLTKLCMLELSPEGSETEGVGMVVDTSDTRRYYTIFLPTNTDLVSYFPLPALKL